MKDWTGNTQAVHATNQRSRESEPNDYYATEPRAVVLLLNREQFAPHIWEPACGEGHISKMLESRGYHVRSTDLIDRGYGTGGVDFLAHAGADSWDGDIITNPPYKYAKEFVQQAMHVVRPGQKVAMLLKLTFLEGQSRRELFQAYPPRVIYVSSGRLECGKNGVFTGTSAVAYCWIVWQKGYTGTTQLKWIN